MNWLGILKNFLISNKKDMSKSCFFYTKKKEGKNMRNEFKENKYPKAPKKILPKKTTNLVKVKYHRRSEKTGR